MAIEIKRPLVEDLFAIGSSVGGTNSSASGMPQVDSSHYTPAQMTPPEQAQQSPTMGILQNAGQKLAMKGATNYATTGSLFGAGSAAAAAPTTSAGLGYGLGGSLVSGGVGGATYAGAGAASAGASAGAAAGGGAGAAGAMSSAGPIGMIAAAIMLNEQDSRSKGLRREGSDYYKDLATGRVLSQDIDGKWAPMTDSIFGEKSGLGNDQRMFGDLTRGNLGGAVKNFKKSSLMTGFGLWG